MSVGGVMPWTRALVVLAAAAAAALPPTPPAVPVTCPAFSPSRVSGLITDPRLNEISGLVAARLDPNVLWVEEDSGNGPWVYAVSRTGSVLAAVEIQDATNVDWEDLARGAGQLWIGDIGDNSASRSEVTLYWFPEPTSTSITTVTASAVTMHYPDGSHDAEAMVVDGERHRLYVFEKQTQAPRSRVYRADLDGVSPGDDVDLVLVGQVPLADITAADLGPDGIVVKNYVRTLFFPASGSGAVLSTLQQPPCDMVLASSEAAGFSIDGSRIYSIPEGQDARISYTEQR